MKDKKEKLKQLIRDYTRKDVMVAFSGGVDSSLLLMMVCEGAKENGSQVYGVTMQTSLHPAGEIQDARRVAEEIGAAHVVMQVDEMKEAGIENNPVNRCYLCKKLLFKRMRERAESLKVSTILEGTNEDDLHVYRPGLKALKELDIKSPLAEAGLTKEEVRQLASEYGLSVSDKPAMPCLATRFPYGTALTYEKLNQAEKGELYVKSLGIVNVRLRIHDNIARLEVEQQDLQKMLEHREQVVTNIKKLGFDYVVLDLEGFRSGSMDIGVLQ